MAYLRLALKAGIDKQNTEYGAEGGWTDADFVRFRYGLPEKIGGWTPFGVTPTPYLVGMASNMLTWNDLDGLAYVIIGTHKKLYAFSNSLWADVTPIRTTTLAGDVTFAASTGSSLITVTDTAHGAVTGDFVTFSGAVSLGGTVTAPVLNQQFEITDVIDANEYTITVPVTANASDTGDGGAAVVGVYQINVGKDVSFSEFGWGTQTWNLSTWGTPRPPDILGSRVWQFDLFGEDVICQIADNSIFLWDTSAGVVDANKATLISGAPTNNKYALVSTPDRHLVCFGTESTIGSSTSQDPMFVRFSNQEDINTFVESATNTAGGQRLTDGSTIVSAVRSRGQILIFTDTSIHGMQYVGPPYTFGFQQLGTSCGCIGPHAAVDVNGLAFWMSSEAFYMFDGTVKKMPCTVQDFVFKDLNVVQGKKVFAGINSQFNEVTWWYCSLGTNFVNRFVTYNYLEGVWSIGSLARTTWVDLGTYAKPLATEYEKTDTSTPVGPTIFGLTPGRSFLYKQEDGVNADGQPITAFIESGYFDIGEGDTMLFMKRFVPDFTFQQGNLEVQLLLRAYPQAAANPSSLDPYLVTPTTQKVDTRARGRQISLRIESDEIDTNWRYGTLRVDLIPDGLR